MKRLLDILLAVAALDAVLLWDAEEDALCNVGDKRNP